MCGIAGIVSLNNKPIDLKSLADMTDIVKHRGPDGEGFLLAWDKNVNLVKKSPELSQHQNLNCHVGLGHRRLAIIDLTEAGSQPMASADNKHWIVHNGEVYNYIELRRELEAKGYEFKSSSDTEVILASYREWGQECLRRFNGMWAFAILDLNKNILFCSRDRMGIKPFYYYFDGNTFVFSSEIKQLFCHKEVPKKINDGALYDYLVYGLLDHSEETFYKDIKQLKGAHYLNISLNDKSWNPEPVRYWDIDLNKKIVGWSDAQYEQHFRDLFQNSIRLRLRSDVPVGSCLSGGLDSSGIVSVVNKLLRYEGKSDIQKTFSACFEDKKYDERQFIEKVIQFTKVEPFYVFPSGKKLFEELDKLTWHQDEPFGSTSIYSQWNVFRLAKENNVTVMLDGQGGDEILAGYPTYMGVYFITLLTHGHLFKLANEVIRYYSLMGYSFTQAVKDVLSVYTERGLYRLLNRKSKEKPAWLKNEFWQKGKDYSPYHKSLEEIYGLGGDRFDKKLYQMFFNTNLSALLHYEDRNSMAFSRESRVPFLDYRLVEFMFSTPTDQKIRNGWPKHLYREAMKGLIPKEVRLRKDKMGFVTPEEVWMKDSAKNNFEEIISEVSGNDHVFNADSLKESFGSVVEGHVPFNFAPWRWINTIAWKRHL